MFERSKKQNNSQVKSSHSNYLLRSKQNKQLISPIVQLQGVFGNQFTGKYIQTKLAINQPGDKYEQEADRVAEQVMQVPEPQVRREADYEDENEEPVQSQPFNFPNSQLLQRQPVEAGAKNGKETFGSSGSIMLPIVDNINHLKSDGQPLPEPTRQFFESFLGVDFEGVRIHKNQQAAKMARATMARAFTIGGDIVFGAGEYAPETMRGKKLIAHELMHVVQQDRNHSNYQGSNVKFRRENRETTMPQIFRVLNAAQVAAAISYNNARYDERSIRIIQIITGTNVDGIFGQLSAQAVAAFQLANGLVEDGKVGENTLNVMVPNRAAAAGGGRHEHAIQLVEDFYNLNVTSDTLTVHFDPTLAVAGTVNFETGNLRVIRVGPPAFLSAISLRDAINAQLAAAVPAVAAAGPRPTHLTPAQEMQAIAFNRRHYHDRRSVLGIQGLVGTALDGIIGRDTVERIAEFQSVNGLTIDGKVGDGETLPAMTTQLIAAGSQNAAIRMIVDFYNLRDNGNLLDVRFDPTVAANAATDFRPNEPVRVRVGPSGLAQPFPGIVHTIAHEFEHVRRLKEGIATAATHEFLGEATEILSVGMPEEDLEALAPGAPGYVAGFADDAGRALNNWNAMPLADQRRFRARFIAVRQRVRARIAAGTPAQQALHAPLLAAYNAVVLPPP